MRRAPASLLNSLLFQRPKFNVKAAENDILRLGLIDRDNLREYDMYIQGVS